MEVQQLLAEKARDELRETESRKQQSLQQFKQWLKKHPFLKRTRQDDNYLTLFLRTKKYFLSDVYKAYERHFLFRIKRAEWFDVSDEKTVTRLRGHIERGTKYVIADLTSVEPVTYVERLERFDNETFPFSDIFYSDFMLFGACLEVEKAQICGFRLIVDCSNVPLAFFASLSINDVMDWTRALVACPGRYKQCFIVNLPNIAMTLYNIASMMLPEKMRNRIILVPDCDDLKKFMDVSKLPKEFGGNSDVDDFIQETLKIFDENLKFLKMSDDYEIDLREANFKLNHENVGSFRKLEID